MRKRRTRRGRWRCPRWISFLPPIRLYQPYGVPISDERTVFVTIEEFEAMRLVDYEGMLQEDAAIQMGVSRRTLWNDLKSGRKKVLHALIHGYAIRIEGGDYMLKTERR